MATLTSFYPYIVPHVSGCPEITIDTHLMSSIIEFSERTMILERDHDPVTIVKDISDYDFEPPINNHLVIKIVNAWCQGQSLHPIAPDGITDPTIYNRFANKDNSVVTGKPRNIFQKDERTFTLLPVPDETVAQSLTMRVALKPTRSATTVEDVFYEDYAEIIADGALSKLMLIPAQKFTNPQMAGIHNQKFVMGINKIKQIATRGFVRSNVKINIPRI